MSRGAALCEAAAGMHHLVRLAFLAVGDFPFQQLSDGRAILVLMQAEHPARRERDLAHAQRPPRNAVQFSGQVQGSQLDGAEREEFLEWLLEVEYGELQLPKPGLVVLLDAHPKLARELVAKKGARSYTTLEADILESDEAHGDAAREIYLELARRDGWHVVGAAGEDGAVRDVDEIAADIWAAVEPRLS